MAQLHKKFTDSQVKELVDRYLNIEIKSSDLKIFIFSYIFTSYYSFLKQFNKIYF